MGNSQFDRQQECERCVMDVSAKDIEFDNDGFCNFCNQFAETWDKMRGDHSKQSERLSDFTEMIKKSGRKSNYDCIVGISGGVDSSYLLVKAKEAGLRPLAVHMDNGWNSELAQNNICNLVRNLDVDLETVVIRWSEYRALMQAFFDADVIDIELLYDNAVGGSVRRMAKKHGVDFVLSGTNLSTEGMPMPRSWNWYKSDARNIRSIALRNGTKEFGSFPFTSTSNVILSRLGIGLKTIHYLDLVGYEKRNALELLTNQYGFKPYPYKHYESVFTRFYQGFILPEKFGIDKRRHHLSNLIVTNQISREAAKDALITNPYPDPLELRRDTSYFLKKMGWSTAELEDYLTRPERPHSDYPNERRYLELLSSLKRLMF